MGVDRNEWLGERWVAWVRRMRWVRRVRQLLLALAIVAAAAGSTSGCGSQLAVLRQTLPNPLAGQRAFVLAPIEFDAMVVGFVPEGAWLAARSPTQCESWEVDKVAMSNRFAAALARRAEPLALLPAVQRESLAGGESQLYVVRPRVTIIEPGRFFGGFNDRDTEVQMRVEVLDPWGRVVDEVALRTTVHATAVNASIGGRVRAAGARLGVLVADYLRARASLG
jgi:hypothetical protein